MMDDEHIEMEDIDGRLGAVRLDETLGTVELPRAPDCYGKRGERTLVEITNDQTAFIARRDFAWRETQPLAVPYPSRKRAEKWDDDHVKLPNSEQNKIDGNPMPLWEIISRELNKPIKDFNQLTSAIQSYNPRNGNFGCLKMFFDKNTDVAKRFFSDGGTLFEMQKLALELPNLITRPIPFLKVRSNRKLTMSQQQVACLLANAFLCTFPNRDTDSRELPKVNFKSLFNKQPASGTKEINVKIEKISCLIHYFYRVTLKMPKGVVTYKRQFLEGKVKMTTLDDKHYFTKLSVVLKEKIEDRGIGMLQVAFANRLVGGSILDKGCVQEQIRHLICPEMLISRLFTPALTDLEALIVTGCERFSNYSGYADSFKFDGNHLDLTARDAWGRTYNKVVSMDALDSKLSSDQFREPYIEREFNKAYCAFKNFPEYVPSENSHLPAVCTGHWGCGSYRGNIELKAFIQIMAASYAGRDVCYLAMEFTKFAKQLKEIHDFLHAQKISLGRAWKLIREYGSTQKENSFFDYLIKTLSKNADQRK